MWSGIRERFDKLWLKGIFLIQKLVSEGPSLLTQAYQPYLYLFVTRDTTIWTSDPGQKELSSNKFTRQMQRTSRTPHDTTNFRILQHFHQASRVAWRNILASSKENIAGPVQSKQYKNLSVHLHRSQTSSHWSSFLTISWKNEACDVFVDFYLIHERHNWKAQLLNWTKIFTFHTLWQYRKNGRL